MQLLNFKEFLHKVAALAQKEINENSHLNWLKKFRHENYWHLNQYSVAAGLASGIFAAFIPLPMQMLMAGLLAILLRGNILLAIAATWITNPITFIPITVSILKIGNLVTNTVPAGSLEISDVDFEIFKTLWKPLLAGSAIVAISASSVVFILIYSLWGIISKHHKPN